MNEIATSVSSASHFDCKNICFPAIRSTFAYKLVVTFDFKVLGYYYSVLNWDIPVSLTPCSCRQLVTLLREPDFDVVFKLLVLTILLCQVAHPSIALLLRCCCRSVDRLLLALLPGVAGFSYGPPGQAVRPDRLS